MIVNARWSTSTLRKTNSCKAIAERGASAKTVKGTDSIFPDQGNVNFPFKAGVVGFQVESETTQKGFLGALDDAVQPLLLDQAGSYRGLLRLCSTEPFCDRPPKMFADHNSEQAMTSIGKV